MIKVDIEGHEYKFVTGAKETLKRDMPMIYLEYSDVFQKRSSETSGEELLSLLFEFGYKVEILHRSGQPEKIPGSTQDAVQRLTAALAESIAGGNHHHIDLYFEGSRG